MERVSSVRATIIKVKNTLQRIANDTYTVSKKDLYVKKGAYLYLLEECEMFLDITRPDFGDTYKEHLEKVTKGIVRTKEAVEKLGVAPLSKALTEIEETGSGISLYLSMLQETIPTT